MNLLGKTVIPMDSPGDQELEQGPGHSPEPPPLPPFLRRWPEAPPLPTATIHAVDGYDPNKVYGVTRRFSLATLMMMMAGASLLLAGMNALDVSPFVSGTIVLLCAATAFGQMLLFRGEQPREASLIVGAAFFAIAPLFISLAASIGVGRVPDLRTVGDVVRLMFFGALFGAIPGYAAGCTVASVLLLMDLTESLFARWRKAREPEDDPWPPPKNRTKGLPPEEQPL
jgi:hypothetical protein